MMMRKKKDATVCDFKHNIDYLFTSENTMRTGLGKEKRRASSSSFFALHVVREEDDVHIPCPTCDAGDV